MFTVVVNLDGVEHKFATLALRASELDKPLRDFGRVMKAKARAKYDAQGFAPLAPSTLAHRVGKALNKAEAKERKGLDKARSKAAGTHPGLIGAIVAENSRAVKTKQAQLQALLATRKGTLGSLVTPLSSKQLWSLTTKAKKTVDAALARPILGKLATSLVVTVEDGLMRLTSRTQGGWSSVHNDGGAGGHGAQIPKRQTVAVEPADIELLISMLKTYLLVPFTEGVHGPGF